MRSVTHNQLVPLTSQQCKNIDSTDNLDFWNHEYMIRCCLTELALQRMLLETIEQRFLEKLSMLCFNVATACKG